MSDTEGKPTSSAWSIKAIATAFAFGFVALVIVLAGLTIPIAGTGVVTDPREVFVTLGAALSGPVGGLIIGVLAGIAEPDGIAGASLLAHVTGAVWMGWAYKKLVYERLPMPRLLVGWAALVLIYYYVFAVPGFVVGMRLFHPEAYAEAIGTNVPLATAYLELARGALPEALLTTLFTTLVVLALPRKHRRPLW